MRYASIDDAEATLRAALVPLRATRRARSISGVVNLAVWIVIPWGDAMKFGLMTVAGQGDSNLRLLIQMITSAPSEREFRRDRVTMTSGCRSGVRFA
jgi:hypothetical protein